MRHPTDLFLGAAALLACGLAGCVTAPDNGS